MNKPTLLFCSLFLFLFNHLSFAQDFWEQRNGPNGSQIHHLVSTDDGRTFYYHLEQGILLSEDGGETWTPHNEGLMTEPYGYNVASMATAPGGKVYIVHYNDVYKLDPTGEVWIPTNISTNPTQPIPRLYTSPQGHLYTVLTHEIIVSMDEGDTFSKIILSNNPGTTDPFTFYGNGDNFFYNYAFGSSWVYRFDDFGVTETLIATSEAVIYDFYYHPDGAMFYFDTIFHRSLDNGNTWEDLELEPDQQFQSILVLMDTVPSGELMFLTATGFYYSDDLGDSWQKREPFAEPNGHVMLPSLYSNDGTNAFFSDRYCFPQYLIRSTDSGQSWERIEGKINLVNVQGVFKDRNSGLLYANSCRYTTWERSADDGNTWTPYYITDDSLEIRDIQQNSTDQLFTLSFGYFKRSDDGGATWVDIDPNFQTTPYTSFYISPQDVLYLLDEDQGYISTDAGESWERIIFPVAGNPRELDIHPNGDIYVRYGVQQGIYRSENLGGTWDDLAVLNNTANLHITSKGHIYFTSSGSMNAPSGTYLTKDGFASYELVFEDLYFSKHHIASTVDGQVFLTGDQALWHTADDGLTWTDKTNDLPDPDSSNINFLYIDEEQYLYLARRLGPLYKSIEPLSTSNVVKGRVWFDENNDCIFDGNEIGLSDYILQASENSSTDLFYKSTDTEGQYLLQLPAGDHSIDISLPNNLWESNCTSAAEVSFSGTLDTVTLDFPLSANDICPLIDIDISTPFLRRCFSNVYTVHYCNTGTSSAVDVFIEITMDSFLNYGSATIPVFNLNGNVYTFAAGNLGVNECGSFNITTEVLCDAVLGQEHCMTARVTNADCFGAFPTPEATDCQFNIGAYDPNDKTAFVDGQTEDEMIEANTDIAYKIRFQNTGTDTAFTVVVEDQLSDWLDPASVRPGASSHPYQFDILQTGLLRFTFDDILLPDSNINEPASHGFVKFMVSQKPDVPNGNVIANFADIFFDFNAPIRTNTVELTVGEPNGLQERSLQYTSSAAPNPFHHRTSINIDGLDGELLQFQLYNIQGAMLHKQMFLAPSFLLEMENLPSGTYFYSIMKEGKQIAGGKVVMK
ncbi:MAG: T9SS type A sorting domain-containing protein [Bacteroidota bacterium]